jgi:6-pyruvoyl-tetrahydropterin synthase
MIIKKINDRQTRSIEFLTEFDFKIAYQSKKKNDKTNSFTKRFKDRFVDELNDQNKHMHQTILSTEKIDSRIVRKLNDTKENSDLNSKLFLFDKIKTTNQENATCIAIRNAIQSRKKFFDEMLLKKFEVIENTLFFKKKL